MKAAFYTLGCKVNQYESNEIAVSLKNNGYTVVSSKEDADVYIINSCTVTAESSRKSRQAVRRFRSEHPKSVIVLTGCYPQAFENEARELTQADIVLGTKTNDRLVEKIDEFFKSRGRSVSIEQHLPEDKYKGGVISDFEGHTRAFIKIQDGCNRRCTYCIIPESRGFSRSKPLEEIKRELTSIAGNGYKEVVFVGINLSSYGFDIGLDLGDAMIAAEKTEGIERIRLGSLEPDHITDELIEKMRGLKKFCPQFHLSLQSGSDTVLKRMNRHYSSEEYYVLCKKLKKAFPDLSLTTDIIVGFPGETDEEFEETMRFAEKTGFMKIHIFPFSSRKGTPADGYPDKIDNSKKELRCGELDKIAEKLRKEYLVKRTGTRAEVLFEAPKNGFQHGYTKNYIPVKVRSEAPLTGMIKTVIITGTDGDCCTGTLVT